jgi:hypothetical protein
VPAKKRLGHRVASLRPTIGPVGSVDSSWRGFAGRESRFVIADWSRDSPAAHEGVITIEKTQLIASAIA